MAKDRRLEERREKILDAASSVLRSKGYERTSVDEIVALSGGSKATVYKLFQNKEGILRALLDRTTDRVISATEVAPEPETVDEFRELLRSRGYGLVANVLNEELMGLYSLAVETSHKTPSLGQLFFSAGPERAQREFAELLAKLHDKGLVETPDPALASSFFSAMIVLNYHLTMSLNVTGAPTEEEGKRFVEGAVEAFMKAFVPEKE